jgi:SagB-type dehydrogenase family enzyme
MGTERARFFHFATQRVRYDQDPFNGRARLAAHARRVPPPSPYKETGGHSLPLDGRFSGPPSEFWDVLRKRRTLRRFARAPLTKEALGRVLLWTWGKTQYVKNPALGSYLLKTSPSGGARHPIEVYVLARRVTGIRPGVYHYSVKSHALEYLRPAPSADRVVTLLAHQPWVRQAPVVFFMTAVIERSMWKYKHAHAYRVLLLDAGHLGQTFHLVCTCLGLAPFTSSAKGDQGIERLLGIDGVTEISLYAAATGLPAVTALASGDARSRASDRTRRREP